MFQGATLGNQQNDTPSHGMISVVFFLSHSGVVRIDPPWDEPLYLAALVTALDESKNFVSFPFGVEDDTIHRALCGGMESEHSIFPHNADGMILSNGST